MCLPLAKTGPRLACVFRKSEARLSLNPTPRSPATTSHQSVFFAKSLDLQMRILPNIPGQYLDELYFQRQPQELPDLGRGPLTSSSRRSMLGCVEAAVRQSNSRAAGNTLYDV